MFSKVCLDLKVFLFLVLFCFFFFLRNLNSTTCVHGTFSLDDCAFGVNLRSDPSRDPSLSDLFKPVFPSGRLFLANLINQELKSINKNKYGLMVLQTLKH